MTNLVEKTLLVGFGIFTLIIFLSIIFPFFEKLEESKENNNDEEELDKKILFFKQFEHNKDLFIERSKKIQQINQKGIMILNFFCKIQIYNFN